MHTRILNLLLILIFLISACTPASAPAPAAGRPQGKAAAQSTQAPPNSPAGQATPQPKGQPGSSQQGQQNNSGQTGGGAPPQAAIQACVNKAEQAACTFESQKGTESGVCETVQNQLACSPRQDPAADSKQQPGSSQPQSSATKQPGGGQQQPGGGQQQPGGGQQQPGGGQQQPGGGQQQPGGGQQQPAGTKQPAGGAGQQPSATQQPGGSQPAAGQGQPQPGQAAGQPAYNTEQAISDKAQGMTIAYDALAFLTGDLGSDSFFPPGKVADFWGFQYLRDNDPSEMGHAGDFLTSAAMNMLNVLTAAQRAELVALAKSQVSQISEYGYMRFVLMDAFRRLVNNKLPSGTTGLNADAVKTYSAKLYRLDGQISYARAQLMGKLITSFSKTQLAYLDAMVGKGMLTWPKVEEPADIKGLDRDVKVAVMTYAGDMYSWYAGSVAADVYFCPERHGTYFGSFYLKDIHAMSDPTYSIPTNLTGDLGEAMLKLLSADQAKLVTSLVDIQKPALQGIVATREQLSVELRKFKSGASTSSNTVLALMEKYGQYDGEIIYNMAVNFNKVYQSLTSAQKTTLLSMRKDLLGDLMYPKGAYLYSEAISMPQIPNTDFLFK